jgi:hypothetical protein|tara:strand:+ start:372 stop:668 length:297 start_codon:yes stop_codon:yes gene_type:complete
MAHSPTKGPSYYQRGRIQVWDFIRDQDLNFHLGNAVKYICRAGYKDDKIKDLEKAIHYLENELHHVQEFDGSGGGVSSVLQYSAMWNESETDPEVFDR